MNLQRLAVSGLSSYSEQHCVSHKLGISQISHSHDCELEGSMGLALH